MNAGESEFTPTKTRDQDVLPTGGTVSDEKPFWETVKNENVRNLPNHLKQFIVNQTYDGYTPIDHAVWRYIMRQNVAFHREHAHKFYFKGLIGTGIDLDKIPRIEEMNRILAEIGWGAVAVDGFIPPAAFMEFQAHRVLPIACDMRQIQHIEYTPAPDIVHEAAGHAPIIVDREYAEYLRRFGEIGANAMSSRQDFELYEAIRRLSILKELRDVDPEEIKQAEEEVEYRQENLGEPSEMALLSRLHWWTVEYGLIGKVDHYKIYGAGLLSSIGEAESCLDDEKVKKIAYDLGASEYAFDITTQQPQLFVTEDFEHLNRMLEKFADSMAFSQGGKVGLDKAIQSNNIATAVYSSGLQVTGVFVDALYDANGNPYYIKSDGPSALAFGGSELDDHGKDYHADGFGSPVGDLKGSDTPLEDLSDEQLSQLGITAGSTVELAFNSGVRVRGHLDRIDRRDGRIVLMVFTECTVTDGDTTLFEPSWGTYDMAVGKAIDSVFCGAADKDAYDQVALISKQRTIKVEYTDDDRRLHDLYHRVRQIRDAGNGHDELRDIWSTLRTDFQRDWLLQLEILEILHRAETAPDLAAEIRSRVETMIKDSPEYAGLLSNGLTLIENPPNIDE